MIDIWVSFSFWCLFSPTVDFHLPSVENIMEYEAVVATIAAAAKVQQPCVMELNVVARALIDVLV